MQAVRSKFEARFQYLVIAASQYAAPALTVLLSLALLIHAGSNSAHTTIASPDGRACPAFGSAIHANPGSTVPVAFAGDLTSVSSAATGGAAVFGGANAPSLGLCAAARRVVGARPWHEVANAGWECVEPSAASGGEMARGDRSGGGGRRANVVGKAGAIGGEPSEAKVKKTGNEDQVVGAGKADEDEAGSGSGSGSVMGMFMDLPRLPEVVWSGSMGFLSWWACLSWALTYGLGVVFWRLYPEERGVGERAPRDTTTKSKRGAKDGRGKGKAKGRAGGAGKAGT